MSIDKELEELLLSTTTKSKSIDINAAISIIARAFKSLVKDLSDGFQARDAISFIGNLAHGFHRVYGGWVLALIARICGK